VKLRIGSERNSPLRVEVVVPAAPAPAPAPDPNKDMTFAGLATWLSGGFVVLTTLLTAVGSYTGGVARILRNDGSLMVLVFLMVFVSVVLAVVAGELAKSPTSTYTWSKGLALIASIALFLVAMVLALQAAVSSTTATDRPAVTAQLAANDVRVWTVKGTATTNGLKTGQQMQVLVYGVPSDGGAPVRIYFATVGPNADGVASESFDSPLPARELDAIVVTASGGTLPRDCANRTAFYAQSNTVDLTETTSFADDYGNACVTLAWPPPVPALPPG